MNKKTLLLLVLAVVIAIGTSGTVLLCSAFAEQKGHVPSFPRSFPEEDDAVEENVIYVHGFGPIHKLDYLIRYGEGDLVILGVDAGWIPKQSIVYQEALKDVNMLYLRPPASNEGYAPVNNKTVSETNKNNQKLFAQQMVRLLGKKFPTQRVVLFGFSRGGWYLDELYKELKDHGREVLLAWCNDACPGDDKTIFGFPAIEEDGIPVYVAVSTRDGGKIVNRTKRYGESGNPDIVFFKQYDCKHAELSAAAAEDIKDALRTYEE